MKYDPTSRKKQFMATRLASAILADGAYSPVRARKIGLPPSGFTIGNNALSISNRTLAASSIVRIRVFVSSRDLQQTPLTLSTQAGLSQKVLKRSFSPE